MPSILTFKPSASLYIEREFSGLRLDMTQQEEGLAYCDSDLTLPHQEACFPYWVFHDVEILKTLSPADWFLNSIRNEKIESPWPLLYLKSSANGPAPSQKKSEQLKDKLGKKISRVAKLAYTKIENPHHYTHGLFVLESSTQLIVCKKATFFGQKRMKDDPLAPSRSYLKIEEAFSVFGRSPSPGETVVDLGAAPGGWSWGAAKRGAKVIAIDNGPMTKVTSIQPNITHIPSDAFRWNPPSPVDWLFCDVVDDPYRVQQRIHTWLDQRWCKYAIVNFKFGRFDPNQLLKDILGPNGLKPLTKELTLRQLYHDRDEFTLLASI